MAAAKKFLWVSVMKCLIWTNCFIYFKRTKKYVKALLLFWGHFWISFVKVFGTEHWTSKNILSQSSTQGGKSIKAAAHFTWMSLIFPDCLGRSQIWQGLYIMGCKNVVQVKHTLFGPPKNWKQLFKCVLFLGLCLDWYPFTLLSSLPSQCLCDSQIKALVSRECNVPLYYKFLWHYFLTISVLKKNVKSHLNSTICISLETIQLLREYRIELCHSLSWASCLTDKPPVMLILWYIISFCAGMKGVC